MLNYIQCIDYLLCKNQGNEYINPFILMGSGLHNERLCNSEVCDMLVLSARGPQARAMIKRHVPHFTVA